MSFQLPGSGTRDQSGGDFRGNKKDFEAFLGRLNTAVKSYQERTAPAAALRVAPAAEALEALLQGGGSFARTS